MPDTLTQQDVETVLGVEKHKVTRPILRRWRLILLIFAILIAIVMILPRLVGGSDASDYVTRQPERGSLIVTVSATGSLQPLNEVDVGIEVSGTIAEVLVDFNDVVSKGDILARLDMSVLQAEAEQSRSALASARASLELANATEKETSANLMRLTQLRERSAIGLPADRDLDAVRAAHQRAVATVDAERARIREIAARSSFSEIQLQKAVVRSPINGIVLSRYVDPGQTIAAALQAPKLFVLAEDLSQMELHVDVDEADVGQVRPGQDAAFAVDAYPDLTFPADIKTIRYAPRSGAGVVTYEGILSVDNSDLLLRPGMTATAEITVDEIEDALLIPNEALRFAPAESQDGGGGFASAFVPKIPEVPKFDPNERRSAEKRIWILKDGAPEQVSIRAGATDGNFTEVVSGPLTESSHVIIEQVNKP